MNTTIKLSLITTLLLSTNLIAEEKLEDITVTSATKTIQKLTDVTSNMNVITAQEIEERHYTTVTEALNSLPGVSYTQSGGIGTQSSIFLRGHSSEKTLVLIDGIRYNDLTNTNGTAPFDHLMISDISRIEVLKGAQSGVWGADAAAGVINIITKEAKKGLSFHVAQEFGSFGTSKLNIGASYKNDDFYVKASHNNINSNSFSSQVPQGENLEDFEDDAYNNKTSNLKAGFNINSSNKIEISHTLIEANSQFDSAAFPATPTDVANSTNPSATTKDQFSSLNFNHIDSFNEMNLYAKKSSFDRSSISASGPSKFKGNVKEYGLNSKIPYLSESFLLVGGDYKKFESKESIRNSYNNKAIFLTNNNKIKGFLGGTTILTESLRHDSYSAFKNKTTGKIGLKHIHENIKGLSTSANYGTAYNIPTLYNLYEPSGAFGPVGNPNLQPEDTKAFDITVAYNDLSLTYFNTKIDNLIGFTTGYNNISGISKIKGYELAYNTTLFDSLALSLGYTNLDAKDKDGNDLLRRPKQSLKFGIDYYGIDKVHLGLNGEYVGERDDKDFSTSPATKVDTGNYTIANFTANYEVDKHMSVYAKVDNITDKTYQTVYGYATSPRAVYAGMKLTY